MNADQIATIETCVRGSLDATVTFPEIVGRLREMGVERYHVDYTRHEATYYLANGDSHVVSVIHPAVEIADEFSASGVEGAIRASQRGEITYTQFLERTMAAGCVGYFVQIVGARAQYFGRHGDLHLEPFPPAP